MEAEEVLSIFLKIGWVGRKDSVTDGLLFTIRWLSHLSLNTQVKSWRACGSKNTHLPRNGREVVGETSRDFMPWGYKLQDKDGARALQGPCSHADWPQGHSYSLNKARPPGGSDDMRSREEQRKQWGQGFDKGSL